MRAWLRELKAVPEDFHLVNEKEGGSTPPVHAEPPPESPYCESNRERESAVAECGEVEIAALG